jgi:hypothetical protein
MIDFSIAVSSRYYGAAGRSPAGGASAAVWKDFGTSWWQLARRVHTVLWGRKGPVSEREKVVELPAPWRNNLAYHRV